mmetsp:Transcript_17914/g.45871  ORF Transcript_17914/g.45871 Transcript_17914/m.45871 type:complete len:223 (-) Transcript_17914:89-757(-)
MRFDMPASKTFSRDWTVKSATPRSILVSAVSTYPSAAPSAFATSDSRSYTPSLARLRTLRGPKVDSYVSAPSRSIRRADGASLSSPIGSLCCFMSTEYGSFTFSATSSRKACISCCPTTRVLPNQRRSGAMRAHCMSRTWLPTCRPPFTILPLSSRLILERYMLSRLIVPLSRSCGPEPLARAVATRLTDVDAFEPVCSPLACECSRRDLGILAADALAPVH